jgi:hypothetical protein
VFDNGAAPAVERHSRGLILGLDEASMSAELLAQYSHGGILAGSQGNIQLLENGNVFVGWGEIPRVTEFDHGGRIVFDALLGAKYQCYRAFRQSWTGSPAESPALAVRSARNGRDGREQTLAYASWNGATEVAGWQLLAGADENDLHLVASLAADGFETALRTSVGGPWFAARALDVSGTVLGQSAAQSLPS